MIRVVVADDHPVVRLGIVGLLDAEPDIEVVGEAADGEAAVALAASLRPEVVLMDLRMPGLGGVEATGRILAEVEGRPPGILVFTTYEDDERILDAIEAGAGGYLMKAAPSAELLAGVRAVALGQTVLAPSIAAQLVVRARRPEAHRPRLSPRELDILRQVAAGRSNPDIARALFIGESTVKTHLLHAFEKLGVSDRTHAVMRAMELGAL